VAEDVDISVGIPTRNGGAVLRRALEAVQAQATSCTVELLAIDSGSSDGTLDALAESDARIVRVDAATFDWGATRERLFAESRGGIVVNLSQDAVPASSDWLERLVAPLWDDGVAVSCGSSIPDPKRGHQFAWERNGMFYFTREMQCFRATYGRGLSLANTAVRRSVWEQVHFDPQATGEDFQLQQKLHAAGMRIAFPEDAPVLHHHHYSLRGIYRRCRNEGLALRDMGFRYTAADAFTDVANARVWVQWLREIRYGRMRSAGEFLYPMLRPAAVFHGSAFAKRMVWY